MGSWINHWSQTRLRVANSYCQRWLYNTIHVNDMVYVYIKVGYITENTHRTSGHHWANPHGCWVQTEYESSCTSANTKNIGIIFAQCWTDVEDVGPTLYKCYTNVLCLLGSFFCNIPNLTRVCIHPLSYISSSKHETSTQCRTMLGSVVEGRPTLVQLWVDALCLLGNYGDI